MPYYLVTHTSLVESEDEVNAAHKVLAMLKSDSAVALTVKFDEDNIRPVTVTYTFAIRDGEARHSSQWHL